MTFKTYIATADLASDNRYIRFDFGGRSTSIVEKKSITLSEALAYKLNARQLDAKKCIAYDPSTNVIIDWQTYVNTIEAENISIVELNDNLRHKCQKAPFKLINLCILCKKRFTALGGGGLVCAKCNYTVCANQQCQTKLFECIVCKNNNIDGNLQQTKIEVEVMEYVEDEGKSEEQDVVTELGPIPSKYAKEKQQQLAQRNRRKGSFSVIDQEQIQLISMGRKIGAGSFGSVFQCEDFYHGTVAIKILHNVISSEHLAAFQNEVAILKATRHDNVLLFIGCILAPYKAIVTEWCSGSSLYRHLHVMPRGDDEHIMSMRECLVIAQQTALGMEYLHAHGILHRDLKSNNIFLVPKDDGDGTTRSSGWTIKIGDFGLATVKTAAAAAAMTNQRNKRPSGSILWMAPEVIRLAVADPYTAMSDVYSFGVVMYELATGHLPYLKMEQDTIFYLVGMGILKLDVNDCRKEASRELKQLIVECSAFDRSKRPDFVEINKRLKQILKATESSSRLMRRVKSSPMVLNMTFNQNFL